ncbi:MAG: hypothetical protein M0R70_00130 [Nitrospirae bacterium]|nr:hypothetical protein [Nitrospirota bacterium]
MAQKKLGDLLIRQNRPLDALPHYKIALSLNTGDGELASLISDVEAGRDVSSKIQALKAKGTVEQASKQEQPASTAAPQQAPGPVPSQPSNVEPITPVETPPVSQAVSPAPFTETAQASASSVTETEEPEEVLVVEPLEPEASAQEPPAAGIGLPEAHELPAVPSVVAAESFDLDFPTGDQHPDEPVVSQDIGPETEPFNGEDRETIPTDVSEEISADKIVETGFGEEVLENVPEPSSEDISGKSDDFTTDTLAELYISQGFFEKAVEIYERMLVDKPNSRGLQDKLSWVRAAVARTVTPAAEQKIEEDIFGAEEAREYIPADKAGEVVIEPLEEHLPQQNEDTTGFQPEAVTEGRDHVPTVELDELFIDAEVVAEPDTVVGPEEKSSEENIDAGFGTYQPEAGPKAQTTAGEGEGFTVLEDSSVQAQTGLKVNFEPREYVPPKIEQEPLEATSHQEHETSVPHIAGRKETIARLETWLTTIKKEK